MISSRVRLVSICLVLHPYLDLVLKTFAQDASAHFQTLDPAHPVSPPSPAYLKSASYPSPPLQTANTRTLTNDPLSGWATIIDSTDIPREFCYAELNGTDGMNSTSAACNYLAFSAISSKNNVLFLSAQPDVVKQGSSNPAGVASSTASMPLSVMTTTSAFTESALFRYHIVSAQGDMRLGTKDAKFAWQIDAARQTLQLTNDLTKASIFRIYKNVQMKVLLIKCGPYYVTLSRTSSTQDEALTPVSIQISVTTATFLRSTRQSITDRVVAKKSVQAVDQQVLQYRTSILKQPSGLVSQTWSAYDLALMLLLHRRFHEVSIQLASAKDLRKILIKTFSLIVNDLSGDYLKMFVSFGKDFPAAFDLYQLATTASIRVTISTAWQEVASYFTSIAYSDEDSVQNHFAVAVIAAAKMRDLEEKTAVFTVLGDTFESVMAAYYRASCVLAWKREGLTLKEQVDQVQILTNRYGNRAEELTKRVSTKLLDYWFTSMLTSPIQSYNSSDILVELGLLKHLDPTFIQTNTSIGDRISKPLMQSMEISISSEEGMKMADIATLATDAKLRRIMTVMDVLCVEKDIQIEACVLPQLFIQARVCARYMDELSNARAITNLADADSIDFVSYLNSIQQDSMFLEINKQLQAVKTEFGTHYHTLMTSLSQRLSTATIASLVKSSQDIASSSATLAGYIIKGSAYKSQGIEGSIIQRLNMIKKRHELLRDKQMAYLKLLHEMFKGSVSRAILQAFVSTTYMIFQMEESFDGLRPGGVTDIGSVGSNVASLSDLIHDGKDLSDTRKLKKIMLSLVSEATAMMNDLSKAVPQLTKIRAAIQKLTNDLTIMSPQQLTVAAEDYFDAIKDYSKPIDIPKLSAIKNSFEKLGEGLCSISQTQAKHACVIFPAETTFIFQGIEDTLYIVSDTYQMLTDYVTEKLNERTTAYLKRSIESEQLIASTPNTGMTDPQLWVFQWSRKQGFHNAAACAGVMLHRMYILSAVVQKCDIETYNNGGKPTQVCQSLVYSGEPITDMSIIKLITAKPKSTNQFKTSFARTATIPTKPAFAGDMAYIDLRALLAKQKVTFSLPTNDAIWLLSNGWIQEEGDLNNAVMFVKKLRLKLPARYASYRNQATHVSIKITSGTISDLGPALQSKKYRVMSKVFKTDYKQLPATSDHRDSSCESVEYQNCEPMWPLYCFRSNGESLSKKDGVNPSLFSVWTVEATFDEVESGVGRIAYRNMETPMLLYIDYEVERYIIHDKMQYNKKAATLRKLQDTYSFTKPIKRCCPINHYWALQSGVGVVCAACPNASISQFGGLFCVRKH